MAGSEFLNQQSNPAARCIDGTMRRDYYGLPFGGDYNSSVSIISLSDIS
jgi:hypothetical protein